MSKVKNTKNKLKSKLEAIKKINDDPQGSVDSIYDRYLNDLPTTDQLFGKKLDDFLEKRKKKKENNKDIFSELIDIAESFISKNNPEKERGLTTNKLPEKSKLKQHSVDSAKVTIESSKQIILDNVKKIFFASDGICGTDKTLNTYQLKLKPNEFDFLNVLTVDPSSSVGQIIYEKLPENNKKQVNRDLYSSFLGDLYTFDTNSNETLFNMQWDPLTQEFDVTDGGGTLKVEEFLNGYYSTIEYPDIEHVIKTTMLMTLQGGGTSDSELLNKGLNNLNRLLKKLFAVCGTPTNRDNIQNQNPVDLFGENDEDIESYFDFNDVEGIDLDDEDARLRKVLRFNDCNNFEIPINPTIIEDFVFLSTKKDLNDLVNSTITRTSTDAYIQSNSGGIPEINFNLNLVNLFIVNLPKALIMTVLTPKIFLPIVILYKVLKNLGTTVIDSLTIMKSLSKLFYNIIKELFWKFINEFWKRVKSDLLILLYTIVRKILKNKYKRYTIIITSLIALLVKILEGGINDCYTLFNTILNTIQTALSARAPFNIPGILLGLSDSLPGYSQDRALLNISERIESAGVSLSPIFGEDNNLSKIIKSIIDGNTEELDTNSFIKVANKEMIIPSPVGPIIIPPGILNSTGKLI
jgi:hypothetical protein